MPDTRLRTAEPERPAPAPPPAAEKLTPSGLMQAVPAMITLILLGIAGIGVWALWQAYMAAPWTRDGAVRAYVVTITLKSPAGSCSCRSATTSSFTSATC